MIPSDSSNVVPIRSGSGAAATVTSHKGGLKKSLQCPVTLRKELAAEGKRIADTGYTNRWIIFWGKTVRLLANYGQVSPADMPRVAEYVQRKRFEELHIREAEACPYQTYESGYVQVHPGFSQARAEAAAAREVLKELRADIANRSRVPDDDDDDEPPHDRAFDDQVGPDGKRL